MYSFVDTTVQIQIFFFLIHKKNAVIRINKRIISAHRLISLVMWGFSSCVHISVRINFYDFTAHGTPCWSYINKHGAKRQGIYHYYYYIERLPRVCCRVGLCIYHFRKKRRLIFLSLLKPSHIGNNYGQHRNWVAGARHGSQGQWMSFCLKISYMS